MPSTSQIIPEHSYNYQKVVVNDNSTVSATLSTDSGETKMLFVFASPKGRDRKVMTIDGGIAQFLEEFGIGPFSLYGQPLLNAYAAIATGEVTAHCLRVTATNAAFAYSNLIAKYKVTGATMAVKFQSVKGVAPLTELSNLSSLYTASAVVDTDGFTEVKLFSTAYLGRGASGNNLAYRIGSLTTADTENDYKNYLFEVYVNESGLVKKEEFAISFNEDAVYNDASIFADAVINDVDSGSSKLTIVTYPEGFATIVNAYNTANVDSTLAVEDFDVLLGINKYTKAAITGYTIDTTSVGCIAVNSLSGISLVEGADGDLSSAIVAATRKTTLETLYASAFSGTIDPMIKSKNKFPTNLILDANYEAATKVLLAALATTRGDGEVVIDCGTGITTKQSVATYLTTNLDQYVNNRVHMVDAYCGKIKDPFSKKPVTVTGTYALAVAYPMSFANNNGKHVPVAGNTYGVLSGFIKDSIYPIFDEDIDSILMDELAKQHVNFARINAVQDVIRSSQATRQTTNSNLSEGNNVFILLDIKRDCEKLCANYDYNFSEASDIARFNKDAEVVLGHYAEAQVRSISAGFAKNDWEAERGILHLYVGLVHKDLVKTSIIEIDVNRS